MSLRRFSTGRKASLWQYTIAIAFTLVSCVVSAQGSYTVVVQDIDYYPIYRADPITDSYSGYVRELMDAFANHQGINFEYRVRPIRRMTMEFLANRYDFALPDNPRWDRPAKEGLRIHYTKPLLTFRDAVYVPRGQQDMSETEMEDYGTIYGFTPWKFESLIDSGQVRLKTASRPENLIRMAMAGRVTAFNLAVPVAEYHFRRLDAKGQFVEAHRLMPHIESHYFLSSLKHPDIIAKFDRFMVEHQNKVNSIKRRYGLR